MSFSTQVLPAASAIGVMIYLLTVVRGVRAKGLLFVFPVMITIGLVATQGRVDASNVVGVALIWVFLGVTYVVQLAWEGHIFVADALGVAAYVGLGAVIASGALTDFRTAVVLVTTAWAVMVWWFHRHPSEEGPARLSVMPPWVKALVAGGASAAILSTYPLIAGMVVTFPYQGLFAVVEVRDNLGVFCRVVVRNSLAVVAMFVTMHALGDHVSLFVGLLAGWLTFAIVLSAVIRLRV